MRLKKCIVNSFMIAIVLVTFFAVAINAGAASATMTIRNNVKTFKCQYSLTYSKSSIYPGWTGVTYNMAGYEDSYKCACYAEYGERAGGVFYLIGKEKVASGTDGVIVTNYNGSQVSGEVAKRVHYTRIHYTSSSSSSKKDELTYNVINK